MNINYLIVFPVLGIVSAITGSLLIKGLFHKDKKISNYNIKSIHHDDKLRAGYIGSRIYFFIVAMIALSVWLTWQIWSVSDGYFTIFKPFYIVFGALFVVQLLIAAASKKFELKHDHESVDKFHTSVIIPVYNEDETSLRECLESMFYQTVNPKEIHVVDDGSDQKYKEVKKWFINKSKSSGINASWQRQKNSGKRHAHARAIDSISNKEDTIIITVDSDGVLDPHAIEEGLKPFNDNRIQSVAGVMTAKNAQHNILSRVADLIFLSQQLIDRSTMSQFKSVLVNSGSLAFYRSNVVYDAIEHGYISEEFFGKPVGFSDDSYMTLFALLKGHTVQQPSSIVFADMPITFNHHVRQQLRWNRGSFIRSWWRIKHLNINSFGWIRQVISHAAFLSLLTITIQVLIIIPIAYSELPPIEFLFIPLAFGLLQYSRYFSIRRSDMNLPSQIFSYMLTPLAVLWSLVFLRLLRLYSFVTCLKTGWGTRQQVEIISK